jgi:hypothetical protein
VGKLIAHAEICPIVIPIYHKGMDSVLPEVVLSDRKTKKPSHPISYIPRIGKTVEMYFGEPINFTSQLEEWRKSHPGVLDNWRTTSESLELYQEITEEIRKRVLTLEAEANDNMRNPVQIVSIPAPPQSFTEINMKMSEDSLAVDHNKRTPRATDPALALAAAAAAARSSKKYYKGWTPHHMILPLNQMTKEEV